MNINNQPYYNPYQPRVNPNSIIWVQGIEGAKAYQLLPNSNALLMDSETEKFYIKSSDNVGMCTLRSFTYVEEVERAKEEYVTKKDLEAYMARIEAQYEQLISANNQSVTAKPIQPATNKRSDAIDTKQ